LDNNLRGIAHTVVIHFGQTIYCTADREHSLAEVDIFPAESKQFAQTNPCRKCQTNENAVSVFVAGIDELLLFLTGENLDLRFFIAWQTDCITGVEIDVMFQYCLIHGLVQAAVKIQNGFGRKSLCVLLVVVEVLQELCREVFQLEGWECWCKVIFDVAPIADIGGLLDLVFHIGFQPEPQPVEKGGGSRVNVFLKVDLVLLFVQLLNCLCLSFGIVGDTFRLSDLKIVACCDTNLKSAICPFPNAAFVVVSLFSFHIGYLHRLFYGFVAYPIKMDYSV